MTIITTKIAARILLLGLLFQSPMVFAWCAIHPDLATQFALPSGGNNCVYYTGYAARNHAMCNNEVDVYIALDDIPIRGSQFQPDGSVLLTRDILFHGAGTIGSIFQCVLINARQVKIRYINHSANPGLTLANGEQHFKTNDDPNTSNDIGFQLGFKSASMPQKLPGSGQTSVLDIGHNGTTSGGSRGRPVPATSVPAITVTARKAPSSGQPQQTSLSTKPYFTLEFSYHPRYNDAVAVSTLRVNYYISPGKPLNRINTCAASVNNPNVDLGVYTPGQITNNKAAAVPFSVTYKCDGPVLSPVYVGFQHATPSGLTSTLIRDSTSTAQGVGVAYSDKGGSSFIPRNWMSVLSCLQNVSGYCMASTPTGNGSDGWYLAQKAPNQTQSTQTFYAKMQRYPGQTVTTGTVSAQANVLVTHD